MLSFVGVASFLAKSKVIDLESFFLHNFLFFTEMESCVFLERPYELVGNFLLFFCGYVCCC